MSVSMGKKLSEKCMETLGLAAGNRKNSAVLMLTTDDGGFPHVALLSPYQVLARNPSLLYISIYSESGSCAFLSARKRGTLVVQTPPGVTYVKCTFAELQDQIEIIGTDRKVFRAVPSEVLLDEYDDSPFTQELEFHDASVKDMYSEEFRQLSSIAEKYDLND